MAGASGMVFGRWGGFTLAYLGALSGAVALFLLSRRLSGERFINRIYQKYHFELQGMDQRKVFLVLLTVRIIPIIPTPVVNIGSAVSGVPFRTFFLSSAVGKILWAAVYVYLGEYFIKTHNLKGTMLAAGFILIVVVFAFAYFRKRFPIYRVDK